MGLPINRFSKSNNANVKQTCCEVSELSLFIKMHEFLMLCLRIKQWPLASSASLAVTVHQGRPNLFKYVSKMNVTTKAIK